MAGSSVPLPARCSGLPVRVFMVKGQLRAETISPFDDAQTWGRKCFPADKSDNAGRAALAQDPNNQGSLGLAISEAVEGAAADQYHYGRFPC